jgi:hypothetical protein
MGYEKPHWLLKPEMSSHGIKQSELPILSRQADYDLLSQLLLVPETRLYQMTLHRFSSLFNTSAATENPLLHLQKEDSNSSKPDRIWSYIKK